MRSARSAAISSSRCCSQLSKRTIDLLCWALAHKVNAPSICFAGLWRTYPSCSVSRQGYPSSILEPVIRFAGFGTNEEAMPQETKSFAIARRAALIWVLTWFPLYTWSWGWQNMLHLCDVSVVVACLGLWFRQPLLVSSQALLAPLVGVFWSLDVAWRIVAGHHLVGGTEYMWDDVRQRFARQRPDSKTL